MDILVQLNFFIVYLRFASFIFLFKKQHIFFTFSFQWIESYYSIILFSIRFRISLRFFTLEKCLFRLLRACSQHNVSISIGSRWICTLHVFSQLPQFHVFVCCVVWLVVSSILLYFYNVLYYIYIYIYLIHYVLL